MIARRNFPALVNQQGSYPLTITTIAAARGQFAPRLHASPRAHLVGIAGSGMRALADVLFAAGWTISGSDLRGESLSAMPYTTWTGHDASAVNDTLELIVHSDAVPADNPELERARGLGVPVLTYPQMLAELMKPRQGAAIAGTHGKSTTTAMAAEILSVAGLDPTVIYGATPLDPRSASRLGRGRWLLAEACEYRENFRHLQPETAVITGIELDHVDCFESLADVERAFAGFVAGLPAEGLLLAKAECEATRRATQDASCPIETFGCTGAATWRGTMLRERRGYYCFQLRCRGRLVCDVKLSLPGRHNVDNALAAAALASHCGAGASAIRQGLNRFAGLKRRLERVADNGSIAVVDDFAHHPTEVAAALMTVRQVYPDRRICCVFEPHQASRTGRLLDDFASSLHNAEKIVVAEVYRAREPGVVPGGATAAELAARLSKRGADAVHLPTYAEIKRHVQNLLRPGDVLVTLGAGDIGTIAHGIGQGIREIRKAG